MADINSPSLDSQAIDSDLALMLDEYQVWFLKFLTYFLYSEDTKDSYDDAVLEKMDDWLEASKNGSFSNRSLEQLQAVHTDFKDKAQRYIRKFFERKFQPTHAAYLELMALFEEFISLIRRMEAERRSHQLPAIEDDYLRPPEFLKTDLQRELDRLARNGKPFCLAYVRLMHSENPEGGASFLKDPHILKVISDIFSEALRSYDDAYQFGDRDLVLSLKQIGTYDALSTMERLSQAVEAHGDEFQTEDGGTFQISLSYYVLQQNPNEGPEEILEILRNNLEAQIGSDRKIFSYKETSPLQKFIRDNLLSQQ